MSDSGSTDRKSIADRPNKGTGLPSIEDDSIRDAISRHIDTGETQSEQSSGSNSVSGASVDEAHPESAGSQSVESEPETDSAPSDSLHHPF